MYYSVRPEARLETLLQTLARIMHHAERFHTFDWRPAQRRSVQLDRCEATRLATRMGLICLRRRLVGARGPAAHGPDFSRPSAQVRNNAPSGQLVGSWTRMRAVCSIPRAPILIRRSRMVPNSPLASGFALGIAARTPCISQNAAVWSTGRPWLAVAGWRGR